MSVNNIRKLSFNTRISVACNILLLILIMYFKITITIPIPIRSISIPHKTKSLGILDLDLKRYTKNNSLSKLFICDDISSRTYYGQRGPYWVLYNYIIAEKYFACDESITYTTHADFTFLDNLEPLLERWQGPLSISIYAPGSDFDEALKRIVYLRECSESSLVKDYVTFHFFFNNKHFPPSPIPEDPYFSYNEINCEKLSALTFGENMTTYRKIKRLTYPVNVARNVAREMSTTHFVLASDIELYPSPNIIPDFLKMIQANDFSILHSSNHPKIFPLPIFEVEATVNHLPEHKRELLSLLKNHTAVPFHKYVCSYCHKIPRYSKWLSSPLTKGLGVFHVGKRRKPFNHWEPIYIGTKFDPNYDERLSWEGRKDKMTQGYVLCVMNYEFHILNNAFLVHRPGVKMQPTKQKNKDLLIARQNKLIYQTIHPELKLLFGNRADCDI